jgi:hypothetical protein
MLLALIGILFLFLLDVIRQQSIIIISELIKANSIVKEDISKL